MTTQTKPIEAGWQSYRSTVLPQDASEIQIRECRQAFYAGAAILFEGLMNALDPGDDPTEADLGRMAAIQNELDAFGQEIDKRYLGGTEH